MTKERPILFNTAMVQAILKGRKTQTRRVLKTQPPDGEAVTVGDYHPLRHDHNGEEYPAAKVFGAWCDGWDCPAPYRVGDTLWVREAWAECASEGVIYRADGERDGVKWRPSIHMPRAACRLFLTVKAVRCERLQDISEADAMAEGVPPDFVCSPDYARRNGLDRTEAGHRFVFTEIWDNLNAKRGYGWDKNPLVWVIEFERKAQ